MWFSSCEADPYVWVRPALKSNGVEHYKCVLLYTNDNLAIIEESKQFFREISGNYSLWKRSWSVLRNNVFGTKSRKLYLNILLHILALFYLNMFKTLQRMQRINDQDPTLVHSSRTSRPGFLISFENMILLLISLWQMRLIDNLLLECFGGSLNLEETI